MSYVLSRPSPFQRSGLLGVVVALHAGVLILILAAKTVAPQIMAMPLFVDILQPQPEIRQEPEAKPLPVVRPQPQRQKPAPLPKTPVPVLETTTSTAPAPEATVAVPPENKSTNTAPAAAESFSAARFDADYLHNPAPPYPALARRMGEQGKVILRVLVNSQGTADSADIKTSSGSPRLDDAAQRTVRNWKFVPARRGDTPVHSWVLVPIIFKLEQ